MDNSQSASYNAGQAEVKKDQMMDKASNAMQSAKDTASQAGQTVKDAAADATDAMKNATGMKK